jgi:hypothetical protein
LTSQICPGFSGYENIEYPNCDTFIAEIRADIGYEISPINKGKKIKKNNNNIK